MSEWRNECHHSATETAIWWNDENSQFWLWTEELTWIYYWTRGSNSSHSEGRKRQSPRNGKRSRKRKNLKGAQEGLSLCKKARSRERWSWEKSGKLERFGDTEQRDKKQKIQHFSLRWSKRWWNRIRTTNILTSKLRGNGNSQKADRDEQMNSNINKLC